MRVAVACLALASCNQVFKLDQTQPPGQDAAIDPCSLQPGDPGYHDEDGDGIEDLCDNCPGIANADQANTLEVANGQPADEVGDACDPAPGISGDKIARFISFADASDMALVQPLTGSWHVVDDALAIDATQTAGAVDATLAIDNPSTYAIESGIAIDQAPATVGLSQWAAIWPDYMAAGNMSASGTGACRVEHDPTGDVVVAMVNGQGSESTPLSGAFVTGAAYTARISVRTTTLTCRFDNLGNQSTQAYPAQLIAGNVAFEVSLIAARYQYLVIYDLSGEPP